MPWWCVIVVGLSALDLDVVVENGDEKALRTFDVYAVGISYKFGSIQGVLGYCGLRAKVCPIQFGALSSEKPDYYRVIQILSGRKT